MERTVHGRPPRLGGPGGVPAGDQVPVPAQDRVRPHQQPHTPQRILREAVRQRRQERPINFCEPRPLAAQLPFQHGDLMTQSKNLHVLAPVAHEQHAQHCEQVRHAQICEFPQHERPSCPGDRHPRQSTAPASAPDSPDHGKQALTRVDEVIGKGSLNHLG